MSQAQDDTREKGMIYLALTSPEAVARIELLFAPNVDLVRMPDFLGDDGGESFRETPCYFLGVRMMGDQS